MPPREHFRAHARRRVDLDATIRARTGGPLHEMRVRDLGLGGACVEMVDRRGTRSSDVEAGFAALAREGPITLELMAPTLWDPLLLDGRVAWVRRGVGGRPARAGVRFEHRDPGALYALFRLLGAQFDEA